MAAGLRLAAFRGRRTQGEHTRLFAPCQNYGFTPHRGVQAATQAGPLSPVGDVQPHLPGLLLGLQLNDQPQFFQDGTRLCVGTLRITIAVVFALLEHINVDRGNSSA